jgi:hypothetical protein
VTPPGVFQPLTFEQALAEAKANGVWLIVAATSASSEMAQMMDRTTWTNARVSQALQSRGLAIQIDVDAQPELAKTLGIASAPAVLAFKDGAEKDRAAGFLEGPTLLMWLMGLDHEEKNVYDQVVRKGSGDLERDMRARHSFAKQLLRDQSFEKATAHYVWLWHNMERVDPDMSGVRVSFMASEIKQLVGLFPAARDSFSAIRDDAGAAADVEPSSRDKRLDWVVLNKILGEEDRTLAWFDSVKADPNAEEIVRGVGRFMIDLLKTHGRWADVGRLYRDPLKELAFYKELLGHHDMPIMAQMMPKELLEQTAAIARQHFRKSAAELYVSLRAAGRAADAKAVHEEALRLDPSDEMNAALNTFE